MKRIISFSELREGDILEAICNIPRWIGTWYHYAGQFVSEGERVIVTDIYESGCRVVHPDAGIHYFIGSRAKKQFKLVGHGPTLSIDQQRIAIVDKFKGSWPRYQGKHRTPLSFLSKLYRTTQSDFASVAKTAMRKKTAGKDRQRRKTKTKTNR